MGGSTNNGGNTTMSDSKVIGKPTAGPWAKAETRTEGFVITSRTELIVHSIDEYGHYGPIKSSANADLIAAAPDILEALEYLMCIADRSGDEQYVQIQLAPEFFELARKAIARARGLSQ
jgi:hypothetical protein